MSRYTRNINAAIRIIARSGQVVTWRKPVSNITDPNQPWKTTPAEPVDYQVSMIFLKPRGGLGKALYHLLRNEDVPTGGPRALMGAVNFVPDMTDIVIRDGAFLKIKMFDVVAPSGEPILYDIEFE